MAPIKHDQATPNGSLTNVDVYRPAYELEDGSLERCGRGSSSTITQRVHDKGGLEAVV